jgi:beta-lactam-binding protein with PASTA domain
VGVTAGSAVNLVVSTGPAPPPGPVTVTVPNVVNQTQAAATAAIQGAQLILGTVSQQSSTTVAAGSVISQSPVAGSSLATGSAVSLVVSTGPVSVPNVVNQTQAAATTALTGAGLAVGTITQQSNPTVPSGRVISQNPAAGTSVAAGSAVALVVSTGPAAPPPPPPSGGGGGGGGGGGSMGLGGLALLSLMAVATRRRKRS